MVLYLHFFESVVVGADFVGEEFALLLGLSDAFGEQLVLVVEHGEAFGDGGVALGAQALHERDPF